MPDYLELQPVSDQKRKRVLKREGMLRIMFVDRNSLGPKEKKGLKKRRDVENYVSRQIILNVYTRYATYTRCIPYISDVEWQVYSESPAGPESCRVPCWAKLPPNECLDWWSLSLTVSAPKQLFRFLCVYVDRAASPAHMSKTIVRHCQCSCQVHLLLYNKCIVHTNVLWHVLQVLYIQILE